MSVHKSTKVHDVMRANGSFSEDYPIMSNELEYFDESHRILRTTLAKFVEKEIKPHVEEWEEAGEFPKELYSKAAEIGLLGVGYPEEWGGGGGDVFHQIVVGEELTKCGAAGVAASLGRPRN